MPDYDFDLFVIGGGSGGVRATRVAASRGKRVAIAEEYRFGGTCVIRGCVPKKLFVYASQYRDQIRDAKAYGWELEKPRFHWQKLLAAKNREVSRLEGLDNQGLTRSGAHIIASRAELIDPHTLRLVQSAETVTAKDIVIATGSASQLHRALVGPELIISSSEAFDLAQLPQKILIVGAGYIAVEFANVFHGFGVDVTLIYRGKEILSRFDQDMRQGLHAAMAAKGIRIILTDVVKAIRKLPEGGLEARTMKGKVPTPAVVMLALGHAPNTSGLGLKAAGVETTVHGAIKADAYSRTSDPNIYALGDATDRVQLTPVAIHEAMYFIETVYRNNPPSPDRGLIPTAIISQPEIGSVGLTEAQAAECYKELAIYRAELRPMKSVLPGSSEKSIMKLIVDEASRKVVGAHILGHKAGEMAQLLWISLKAGLTKEEFGRTMAPHPTAPEELGTMYLPSYRIRHGQRIPVAAL